MGFLLNWLLWRRAAKKQEDKNAVIAELAERDPEVREALRTLGVKTLDTKPRDEG